MTGKAIDINFKKKREIVNRSGIIIIAAHTGKAALIGGETDLINDGWKSNSHGPSRS